MASESITAAIEDALHELASTTSSTSGSPCSIGVDSTHAQRAYSQPPMSSPAPNGSVRGQSVSILTCAVCARREHRFVCHSCVFNASVLNKLQRVHEQMFERDAQLQRFVAHAHDEACSLHGRIAQKQSALADKAHRLAQCRKATKNNVMMVTELQSWVDRTAPAIETRHEGHDAQSSALVAKMKKLQARRRLLASRVFEQLCTITDLASCNKDDQQMYTIKTSRITINNNQLSHACTHVLDHMIDSSPTSTTARAHAVWCIAGVLCRCLLLITDTCAPFSQSPAELMLLDTQPAAVVLASVRKHQANVAALACATGACTSVTSVQNELQHLHQLQRCFALSSADYDRAYALADQLVLEWDEIVKRCTFTCAQARPQRGTLGCRHPRHLPPSPYTTATDDWENVNWHDLPVTSEQMQRLSNSTTAAASQSVWGMLTTRFK